MLNFKFTEQQKIRFKQIEASAKHWRKVPAEKRWMEWFKFQDTVYQEYFKNMKRRHPGLSHKELLEIQRKKVMDNG